MNYIDILPQIRNNIFFVRLVMSDYTATDELAIRITARRNDGYYETKIVKYPEEYEGNTEEVLIPFFGMSRSLIAQIVSVRVNGTEIRPAYSELEGLEVSVRYDDSLTRMRWEEDMNNINLDFEVIGSYNPKTQRRSRYKESPIPATPSRFQPAPWPVPGYRNGYCVPTGFPLKNCRRSSPQS